MASSLKVLVPKNATHIVVGPLNAVVDPRSVRWLVYVFENIFNLVVTLSSLTSRDSSF